MNSILVVGLVIIFIIAFFFLRKIWQGIIEVSNEIDDKI